MAQPAQVVGSRQPARPGTDDKHPLAAGDRRRVEHPPPLQRQVAQEPLDRVDRDGAVEVGTVADALARVVTKPPVNRRERIVGHQLTPRVLVATRLRVRQPGLDVLPGWAAGIARGQEVDVDRAMLPGRSGAGVPVHQIGQRRHILPRAGHTGAATVEAAVMTDLRRRPRGPARARPGRRSAWRSPTRCRTRRPP